MSIVQQLSYAPPARVASRVERMRLALFALSIIAIIDLTIRWCLRDSIILDVLPAKQADAMSHGSFAWRYLLFYSAPLRVLRWGLIGCVGAISLLWIQDEARQARVSFAFRVALVSAWLSVLAAQMLHFHYSLTPIFGLTDAL